MTEKTNHASVFEEAAMPPPSDKLTALIERANAYAAQSDLVAGLEEALKAQKKTLHQMKTVEIPDMMAEAGISDLTLDSGKQIKIENFVSGSLPNDEDKFRKAISVLTDIGGEGLIKDTVIVELQKGQHNVAGDLVGQLVDQGFSAYAEMKVHPQSLMAFVREKLAAGEEIDYESLGIFAGRVAKIKDAK